MDLKHWLAVLAGSNVILLALLLGPRLLRPEGPGGTQGPPVERVRPGVAGEGRGPGGRGGASGSAGHEVAERAGGEALMQPLRGRGAAGDEEAGRPRFDWRQVESPDYRDYVRKLRAIGCPEQTVQDIVTADVVQAFAARRSEVMAERYREFEYWRSGPGDAGARESLEARRRAVNEELAGALEALLGPSARVPSLTGAWQEAAWSQQLGFLPEGQRGPVQALLRDYAEVDAQFCSLSYGQGTPENPQERLRVLEAYERKQEALRSMLSEEEYARLEMTVSFTADNLRRAMTKFEPSEEEFRAIFRVWRAQDEDLGRRFGMGQEDPGNEHVFEAIRGVLSPERYERYRATWWK